MSKENLNGLLYTAQMLKDKGSTFKTSLAVSYQHVLMGALKDIGFNVTNIVDIESTNNYKLTGLVNGKKYTIIIDGDKYSSAYKVSKYVQTKINNKKAKPNMKLSEIDKMINIQLQKRIRESSREETLELTKSLYDFLIDSKANINTEKLSAITGSKKINFDTLDDETLKKTYKFLQTYNKGENCKSTKKIKEAEENIEDNDSSVVINVKKLINNNSALENALKQIKTQNNIESFLVYMCTKLNTTNISKAQFAAILRKLYAMYDLL